jgi:hypothetical protein
MGNAGEFWKWLTLVIMVFLAIAVLTHASNAATVLGTMFSGLQGLGATMETGGTTNPKVAT